MENKKFESPLLIELKKIDDMIDLSNEEKENLKKEKIQEFIKNKPKSIF